MTTVCSWLRDRELEGICSEILALITIAAHRRERDRGTPGGGVLEQLLR
jgi:hypothetical protein